MYLKHNSQSLFRNVSATTVKEPGDNAEIDQPFRYKTPLMAWSAKAEDAKMLLNILRNGSCYRLSVSFEVS